MKIIKHRNNWSWGDSVICITSNGYGTATVGVSNEYELDEATDKLVEVREAVITSMSVHPKRRMRGYGNKLLVECEKEAKSMGFDRVYLYATPDTVAYEWYRRHGYLPLDTQMAVFTPSDANGLSSMVKLCKKL